MLLLPISILPKEAICRATAGVKAQIIIIINIITRFSCLEARCVCKQSAVKHKSSILFVLKSSDISQDHSQDALDRLKNYKAAGVCRLIPEMLKYGGSATTHMAAPHHLYCLAHRQSPRRLDTLITSANPEKG